MKRAELGLLEVLRIVVNAGRGGMCHGELRILLTSIFGANKPYFSQADIMSLFLASRQ
jgi:hypothetical protein